MRPAFHFIATSDSTNRLRIAPCIKRVFWHGRSSCLVLEGFSHLRLSSPATVIMNVTFLDDILPLMEDP